jgi:tRNA isopentenyltransferase (miaA)
MTGPFDKSPDGNPVRPVLVIFGATASGKTAAASGLFAGERTAEIISADSMQVYRGMDIGTAKPDASLLRSLPHHLIDIRDPREQFCAGDFVRLSDEACRDIGSRGLLPVVLGGTAFYIKNFLYGLPDTPESDPALREALRMRLEREGPESLWRELSGVDPRTAGRLDPHDGYRIVRALEVWKVSGRPLSSFEVPLRCRPGYRFLVIALDRPREDLYRRIDLRVDGMFAAGLPAEVNSLIAAGYVPSDPGMQAIGYREFFLTDPPGRDLGLIRGRIKLDSRKYAKRQETFIRSLPGILHLEADDTESMRKVIGTFLEDRNC